MKYNIENIKKEIKTKNGKIETYEVLITSKKSKEGEYRIKFKDVEAIYNGLTTDYNKDNILIVASRQDGFKTIKGFKSELDSEEDYIRDKAADVQKFMKYNFVKFIIRA